MLIPCERIHFYLPMYRKDGSPQSSQDIDRVRRLIAQLDEGALEEATGVGIWMPQGRPPQVEPIRRVHAVVVPNPAIYRQAAEIGCRIREILGQDQIFWTIDSTYRYPEHC